MPKKPPIFNPRLKPPRSITYQKEEERPNANDRGYNARWRRKRAAFLKRHPLCSPCDQKGRTVPAIIVHHTKPARDNPGLFWKEQFWEPICRNCHDQETARERRERASRKAAP